MGVAETERFSDRKRPVREVGVGRDQSEARAVPQRTVQGQQRLQAGDAAAGDDDVHARHDNALAPAFCWTWRARVER